LSHRSAVNEGAPDNVINGYINCCPKTVILGNHDFARLKLVYKVSKYLKWKIPVKETAASISCCFISINLANFKTCPY